MCAGILHTWECFSFLPGFCFNTSSRFLPVLCSLALLTCWPVSRAQRDKFQSVSVMMDTTSNPCGMAGFLLLRGLVPLQLKGHAMQVSSHPAPELLHWSQVLNAVFPKPWSCFRSFYFYKWICMGGLHCPHVASSNSWAQAPCVVKDALILLVVFFFGKSFLEL